MDLVLGIIIVIAIALALFFLFKKIFYKNKQNSTTDNMASHEVLNKEVHQFDTKTGGDKGTGPEGVHREKSDEDKEIR